MSQIDSLPLELAAIILRNLDDICDLTPTLLSHMRFYRAFYEYWPRTRIDRIIILKQIDPGLLPVAIANVEASHRTYTDSDDHVREVKGIYDTIFVEPQELIDHLKDVGAMPTRDLIQMGRIHNYIGHFVQDYSSTAWQKLTWAQRPVILSAAETLRFYRAFYHLELFFKLCKGDVPTRQSFAETRASHALLHYPPWEWEQLSCAYRHLRTRAEDASTFSTPFLEAVQFGERLSKRRKSGNVATKQISNTYCRMSLASKTPITYPISQGLELLIKLDKASSVEARNKLLASALSRPYVMLQTWLNLAYDYRRIFRYPGVSFQPTGVHFYLATTDPCGEPD
ncbi:hypothetical protein F5Y14DRAFT_461052 [Nemania sp. NC0429]|nr:hypothetical protein F5Y14DRAFT_461052 [Nemania sp. NC0429]